MNQSSILTGVVALSAALGLVAPPASLAAPPASRWDTTSILVKFRVPLARPLGLPDRPFAN